MGQAIEDRPTQEHRSCQCGNYWIGPDAPHSVNGDAAIIEWQVMGAPKYGREAHTVRECYREVCAGEAWSLALAEWKSSLRQHHAGEIEFALPAPMPVGHVMFAPLAGSAALSRRDNAERGQ